ncbi:TolB family protein [Myxococcus sp. Y35]|uniref:TolB family protein n=1 Tax=Pseudomyxococcus flavus TaxID=3115648 RepID=UPI003CED8DD6
MTMRVVVSALCGALLVLSTGCGDECVDQFDCRRENGEPPAGQQWTCRSGECELQDIEPPPEEDAGTEEDGGTEDDAGTDAGTEEDAGTDAGTEDGGTDGGVIVIGTGAKGDACTTSADCAAGLRCEGTAEAMTCQALHVAFTAMDDADLMAAVVTRFDEPEPTRLSEDAVDSRYPRWNPAGSRIAFVQGATETGTSTGNIAGELVARDVPLVAGPPAVLADGTTGTTEGFLYLEWEPGDSLLYVRRAGDSISGISRVPPEGGTVEEVTTSGTFPAWRNGNTFAFSTATMGISTSTVGGTPTPLAIAGPTAEQPHYNRVNDQLLFLRPNDTGPVGLNAALYIVPVGGAAVQTIAEATSVPGEEGSVDSYIANPTWAPDGSWVAYVRAYFFNPTTGEPVLCGGGTSPCAGDPGNIIFLRRINPADGAPVGEEVSFAEGATLPSFSPDGHHVAYIQGGQLYVQQIDPAAGTKVGDPIVHPAGDYTLQTSRGDDHRPRWQPR